MKTIIKVSIFFIISFAIFTQNICFGSSNNSNNKQSLTYQEIAKEHDESKTQTPDKFSRGILDRYKVYDTSKTISTITYPNSDEVLLDDYIIESYNPDGTSTTWDDTFIKILTEKGRQNNKVLSHYFTLPYSTVDLTLLEIIKRDGSVRNIDIAKQSRIMIDNTQMNANIYNPNAKILKVNIPDLQVGDIIRYVSHRKQVKARMPNTWSDYSIFENTTPIKHLTLEIISPNKLPLKKINLLDKVKGTVSYKSIIEKGVTIHKWEVNDVPRMFPEPNMPAISSVVQRLLVSTVADWETISRWYWNLCLPHIEATTPAIKEKVAELIKDKKTDIGKIKAIYYYVAQQIRYMGLTTEKDAPGYEPHDVNITFNNKYGVCRDKAALLVAMLRLAGFKSYPVLVKVGPKMDIEVPMINFNHAIACVELTPGHFTLLDPTDENSKQMLPPYLCNKSYLVAKPNGDSLRTTPIIPADKNLMQISTNGQLDVSGKLTARVQLNFDGINDNAYRGLFAKLTHQDRQRFIEKVIRNVLPTAKLISFSISPKNMHDTSKPLSVNIDYEAKNILIEENNTAILPLPWFGETVGIINYVIRGTGLKKRKYPLETSSTCGYSENFNIKLNTKQIEFESIPNYTEVNSDTVFYKQNLSCSNKNLKGTSKLLLKVVEFSPKQYIALKNTLQDLEKNRKKMPILSLTNQSSLIDNKISDSDAKIINLKTEIILKNSHDWTEKTYSKLKILSYAGKKKNSEIKISYSPIWESVKIIKAVVTGKDGIKQTISKDEINLMDAAWTGSAPRYPAEKVLVVNLPGVEIGSIIEVETVSHITNRPYFSGITSFRETEPIEKISYKLTIPKNIPLKIIRKNLNQIDEKKIVTSDNITYEWTVEDQKALKKESSLPPSWTFLPTVMLSTGDWETYSELLNKRINKATKISTEISSLAKELTGGLDNIEEKITAIRNYVAQNIRYAGPSFTDMPLSTSITSASKTLSDGYGNSADKAIVLHTILKAAGLDSDFILASIYPANVDQIIGPIIEAPQLALFDSILIAVKTKNDNIVYLNDTDEYSILGATINEYNLGVDLKTATPMTISPLKNRNNKIHFDFQIKLNNNGNAILAITKSFYGNYYGIYNKKFSEFRPEQRSRYYQSAVAAISQSAAPSDNLVTDFKSYPGIEKFSVEIKDYSIINNNFYYFTTPLNLNSIFNLGKNKRFYPYYQDKRTEVLYSIDIKLPKLFDQKIITPQKAIITLPYNSGRLTFTPSMDKAYTITSAPRVIKNKKSSSVQSDIALKKVKTKGEQVKTWSEKVNINLEPTILNPEQYNDILNIDQKISSPSIRTLLLKK